MGAAGGPGRRGATAGGDRIVARAPVTLRRLRLDRARWEAHRNVDVTVEGLDASRAEFGV